ncbi:MAG: hypothetical protein VYE68_07015 [Acidobacteriota bacterium]|nr:hypothetical protein [Acidobacteriota bacterium]
MEYPDTAREREKPEGDERGFSRGLNNYCSVDERPEDTVMQCETITLTCGIPLPWGVVECPFVMTVGKTT